MVFARTTSHLFALYVPFFGVYNPYDFCIPQGTEIQDLRVLLALGLGKERQGCLRNFGLVWLLHLVEAIERELAGTLFNGGCVVATKKAAPRKAAKKAIKKKVAKKAPAKKKTAKEPFLKSGLLTDTEIRYGPGLCPGCQDCIHCQQQRKDVADLVKHLRKRVEELEAELEQVQAVIAKYRPIYGAIGYCEGDVCGRNGCQGVLEEHPVENCSCHTGNPPCGQCMKPREFCPVCDWSAEWDEFES